MNLVQVDELSEEREREETSFVAEINTFYEPDQDGARTLRRVIPLLMGRFTSR